MPSIQEHQAQIVDDFSFLPAWDERYAYLIELGQKNPPLPEEYRTEDNLVRGCQSQVWLWRECRLHPAREAATRCGCPSWHDTGSSRR